ncbi:MAG: protein-methionine-sulfoxide reductase heme-binding subunit MsrQ [Aestuariivita sp.]|nr:protein-methionine-sulfoxide reductase heme-binding subunit MsrQ [Aestuariivita sp.]
MFVNSINANLRRVPKWFVYLMLLLPVPWLLYLGLTGVLGRDPIERLEHELGKLGLQLLIATLAVSPLNRFWGIKLLKFRRVLGVMTFVYISLHLLVWLVLDVQILSQIWADIVKRPYITIGMSAFLIMLPLAITSNDLSVRRLGVRWRQLHKLVYVAVILGVLHFLWLTKGFQLEPLIYAVIVIMLLALRIRRPRRRTT